ncbi:MAG TPA: hypothetical protein VGR41_03070 [Actinomycetota bacterium]|jgi:hypothetical protein|nr:hypothetical protein [Actinomycetota bacterium]
MSGKHAGTLAGICLSLLVAIAAGGFVALTAGPALASWTGDNCDGIGYKIDWWKRSQAKAYAELAEDEGYEWGGGCYKLNGHDDTPGAPDSGGEGNDCSGFVFRVWALKTNGSSGFKYWEMKKDIHGPYTTDSYFDPLASWQFKTIGKGYAATQYMDAFVYRNGDAGHIGLIFTEGNGGGDYMIHAKNDADGTTVTWETYRSSSAYNGVRREDWQAECYPHCVDP